MSDTVPKEMVEDVLVRTLASLVLAEKTGNKHTADTLRHLSAALACSLNLEPDGLLPYLDRAGDVIEASIEMAASMAETSNTIQ